MGKLTGGCHLHMLNVIVMMTYNSVACARARDTGFTESRRAADGLSCESQAVYIIEASWTCDE